MPGGNIQKTLDEIENRWDQLTNICEATDKTRISLPNAFVTPSNGIFHGDQFYWDTYFTIIGLIPGSRVKLAKGMVDNILYLIEQYHFAPMRNRYFDTGISQPPFLTSMIRLIYGQTNDNMWLNNAIQLAEREYKTYWCNEHTTDEFAQHKVHRGLSRYADHYLVHQTAEHESGWDMSSRFNGRCLDILPVDLNAQLYKYETDFAWYYNLHDPRKAKRYREAAAARQQIMNELMWHEEDGRYYDYDYVLGKQTRFSAASCYVPLWAKVANDAQASKMANSLAGLIQPAGIVNTAIGSLPQKQWDHPNGWAPLQWLIISGLRNYGHTELALDLTNRWLSLVANVYAETGELWEKYDVVNQRVGKPGRYDNQAGFGWTNGVFVALQDNFTAPS